MGCLDSLLALSECFFRSRSRTVLARVNLTSTLRLLLAAANLALIVLFLPADSAKMRADLFKSLFWLRNSMADGVVDQAEAAWASIDVQELQEVSLFLGMLFFASFFVVL